jgi:hypothetical protein
MWRILLNLHWKFAGAGFGARLEVEVLPAEW